MDFEEEKELFFFLGKGFAFHHGAIERKGYVSLTNSKFYIHSFCISRGR